MPFLTYPTAEHIELALKSNAIWPENAGKQELARFEAQIAAEGAAVQFENLTGWGPTLAKRDANGELLAETRTFNGGDHNGDLKLKGGLLRLDSVAIGGVVQTRDYSPHFRRYAAHSQSTIVAIEGAFWGGIRRNWIAITGVWGLFAEVPGDVFLTCQKRAIATMMDLIENLPLVASVSQDGFSKSQDIVGTRTQKDIAETGDKNFNTLCANYQRPVF